MKKKKIWILVAVFFMALTACNVEVIPEPASATPIKFNLSATLYQDGAAEATKAVKSGWEDGDDIFVFFSTLTAPYYLKMHYNGSSWSCQPMNGASAVGSLSLSGSGTMEALYIPESRSITGATEAYTLNAPYDGLYWTASMAFTVIDNTVSGAFNMTVPEGFVQFSVPSTESDPTEIFTLRTDAVAPVTIQTVANSTLAIDETIGDAGAPMTGYAHTSPSAYFLFSGKLAAGYPNGNKYCFSLIRHITSPESTSRADYFISGKSLSSHASVKLPDKASEKWVGVGKDIAVLLKKGDNSYGYWYTCNEGTYNLWPEGPNRLNYADASACVSTEKRLPSSAEFEALKNNLTWIDFKLFGQLGYIIHTTPGTAFIFLPVYDGGDLVKNIYYWTNDSSDASNASSYYINMLDFSQTGAGTSPKANLNGARFVKL